MQNEIQNYYDTFQCNTQDLFTKLLNWAKELKEKENKTNALLLELMEKEEEIKNYQKVSFISNMNKQMEEKNILIKHLEEKINKFEKNNYGKSNSSDILDESMFLKDEEIKLSSTHQEKLEEIEYKNKTYLFDQTNNKVYNTNEMLEKLEHIGRINKKGKLKFLKK